MTIRDLVISFGYEVNAQAEKQVNASIDALKSTASKALGATEVGYEVDRQSEKKVSDSLEALGDAAESLKSSEVGFEVDESGHRIAFDSIEELQEAAQTLYDNKIGFEIDEAEKSIVLDSIDATKEAAQVLENNRVGYEVDRTSERRAKDSIRSIRSMAVKFLGAIGIGFSLMAMGRLSEEFGSINDQVRDATRGMGDQADIQQRILKAANEARQDYAVMANTVNRLAMSNAFDNIEDASRFATLMAQDFAAAGKTQEKSAYLTRYITMDLQKGSMSARTLSTALRDSPHMVNRLAESLEVSTDQLQEMARRGEISADMLKNTFIDSADNIAARFAETDMTISDALRNVRNGWGLFIAQMDDTLGLSRMVARTIVNGFNQVLFVLRRAQDGFIRLADRMGGVNNLMRLLAISAGAILVALKAPMILGFMKKAAAGLKAINRQMIKAKLKVLAIVAVVILLALLIDDFLAFMRGDDSLLGKMLEKFGIDADEVREIIFGLWETIKGVLPFLKDLAKQFGGLLVQALQLLLPLLLDLLRQILPPVVDFIRRLIVLLADVARQLIPLIVSAVEMLIPFLMRIIEAILPVLISLIESLLPVIMSIIETVLPIVINLLETLLPIILQVIETILPVLLALLDAMIPIITFVAELLGNVLAAAFEGLIPIINAFMQILGGIIDFIVGVFTGDWERAWEGIRNIFSGIISGLAAIFKLPINLIITGLNTFIRGLNRISIPDWVPGVGGMGINIPEIPMLAKGSDFSPDTFIAGEEGPELITNAKGSKVFTADETVGIFKKLKDFGGIYQALKSMANLAMMPGVDEAVSAMASSVSNTYITMYQDIFNEFHGDRAGQEKSSEAMGGATEDATGELSRALAYVR